MHLLGPIVRLQIQESNLKTGTKPFRQYDPAPIRAVDSLVIAPGGALVWSADGGVQLDVHHRDHPAGKSMDGINAVSVLFTSHYEAMRRRFGDHVSDGVAGESILVETDRMIGIDDLAHGLIIESVEGRSLRLHITQVAEPCVEFTRFNLCRPPVERVDRIFKDALQFLQDGMRGFYAGYGGEPATVRLGDRVYLPSAA